MPLPVPDGVRPWEVGSGILAPPSRAPWERESDVPFKTCQQGAQCQVYEPWFWPDDGVLCSGEPNPRMRASCSLNPAAVGHAVNSRDPDRLRQWKTPSHYDCFLQSSARCPLGSADAHIPAPQQDADSATSGYPWLGEPGSYWRHFAPLSYAGEED